MAKASHWIFREGRSRRKEVATPLISMSQKTYEGLDSSALCEIQRTRFVAEKRLRHPFWMPQPAYFWKEKKL